MGGGRTAITSLSVMAQTLLPTPQAHDAAGAKTDEQIAAMRAQGHGVSNLNEAARHLLPTPKANDHKGATITHGRTRPDGRPYGDGDANLPLRVVELLPTPLSGEARHGSPGQHRTRGDKMLTGEVLNLLSTPGAYDGERGGPQDPAKRRAGGHYVTLQDQACFEMGCRCVDTLLPSPMAADGDRESTTFPRGNPTLKGALLPTPSVATATGGQTSRSGDRAGERLLGGVAQDMAVEWGVYEPAIRRWEWIRGVEAPCPVEPGKNGNPRLAPAFVEWMMGLPPGWVTEVEGLSRAKQLKLLGNGVVPQQVYLALRTLLETLSLME
jgi:DNA (cytosine-5)-methyltransferase 1